MKILILGGHGFVGRNIEAILREETSHAVTSLSRRDGIDLRDYDPIRRRLTELSPDVIFNCAAHVGSVHYVTDRTANLFDDNLQMTLNLYRAVKEVCPQTKIINPISNCSYPGDATLQVESQYWNGPVHPSVWSFGNAKRMLLVASQCYATQYRIRSVNFLIGGVYGPGDYTDPKRTHALNGMVLRMLQARDSRQPTFEIWGSGKPAREWIFVGDLVRILISSIGISDSGTDPVNIAQNRAPTVGETAELIKELSGFSGKLVFNTSYSDGALIKKLDNTLFKKLYPHATFIDMRKGVHATIEYYEKALHESPSLA